MTKSRSIIPWLFVLLIGTFMSLDFAFIKLAFDNYSGTYTDNHFQKGLDYNKVYKSGIYDDKTGWKAQIYIDEKFTSLDYKLQDHNLKPITDAYVEAKIMRPVHAGSDLYVVLKHLGSGVYKAPINLPLKGQWEIRVRATKGDDKFVMTKRINTEPDERKKK